ncbi:MAG TPA: hypothetical protein VN581_09280 [Patescibacteria group bacterium]|nr:hypothetical protein [Patescibacteria group bacterium]
MTLDRPLLFVCLTAFAAMAAHADSPESPRHVDRSDDGDGTTLESTPDTAATPAATPSRFSREGYGVAPQPSARMGTRRDPAMSTDPLDRRFETLRNRYQMPREMSQEMHQAIRDAQRTHGGKILSADRMRSDGRDVYRVKLLTRSGRVRVVQMPENDAAPDARGQQGEQ